jgi:cytochrome c-type protein NapC
MSEPSTGPPPREGFVKRIWRFLWSPSKRFSFAGLLIVGTVTGILLWGAFNWTLELTNTESFCITCHEMRNTPFEELKGTIHWQNRSGVRATCPDCHVPHEWIYKMIAKIKATKDLYHHFMGTYPTEEAFEAHRMVFAQRVWASMKESDSRPCRNCHSVVSMDPTKHQPASHVMMLQLAAGATCIDCHKGIAHYLPTAPVAAGAGATGH